jgi:HD-GYP domain-containing protein (c-di-GMP phosphodiesterase class II)
MGLRRASAHYIWSVLVLGVYGGQVCPYIEGLGVRHWFVVLGGFFAVALLLRHYFISRLLKQAAFEDMVKLQFFFELGTFLIIGLALTAFNIMSFEFPFESGLKVIVGVLTLGFFASADLAMQRERIISEHFSQTGQRLEPREKYFSLTAKFFLLSTMSVILITVVIFLVISKDLQWLAELGEKDILMARVIVLGELAFIASVVLIGIINLLISYSRNLRMFFSNENSSLRAVARGDFTSRVPVSTNDEFGIMGAFTNSMINDLGSSVEELKRTQEATVLSLASLAEIRDMETGMHIVRTKLYVKALAQRLSTHPKYRDYLDEGTVELLHMSAPLHDIGKVGIPDAILLKPARLTVEEFEVMKRHPVLGGDALKEAEKVLGDSSFLNLAREIAYNHHEKYDGSGYPQGLKGDAIPLSGRLMALADVYDALIFKRVYKPAIPHDETRAIILEDRGRHFDPDVVDAFLEIEDEFIQIASQYSEEFVKEA